MLIGCGFQPRQHPSNSSVSVPIRCPLALGMRVRQHGGPAQEERALIMGTLCWRRHSPRPFPDPWGRKQSGGRLRHRSGSAEPGDGSVFDAASRRRRHRRPPSTDPIPEAVHRYLGRPSPSDQVPSATRHPPSPRAAATAYTCSLLSTAHARARVLADARQYSGPGMSRPRHDDPPRVFS